MTGWPEALEGAGAAWAAAMLRACWQGGLALGAVWLACRLFPRTSPRVQCWLWRLAYVKLLLALFWSTPIDLPVLPAAVRPPAAGGSTARTR